MSAAAESDGRPAYDLVIEVDGQLDEDLQDALEYLRDRLVGGIPSVLSELGDAITTTFLEGLAQSGVPLTIVDEDGQPIGDTSLTAEEEAQADAAAEAYEAWTDSSVGAEEIDRGDRLFNFIEARTDETDRLYQVWLEDRAREFLQAKIEWRRARRTVLEAEFTREQQ